MTVEIIKRPGTNLVLYPVLTLQLLDTSESFLYPYDWTLKYNDYWITQVIEGNFYYPEFREKVGIKETDKILFHNPNENWCAAFKYLINNLVLILGEGFPNASPYNDDWGFPFTINTKQSLVQIKPTIKVKY